MFLAQSLCRGVPASNEQVTYFDKVSVINHCVELVFRPLGTGGKKIYGVLPRDQINERLKDHDVVTTCKRIRELLTNTKFDTPKRSNKTKTRPFITGQSLAEYIRCYRDCLVWYCGFVETYHTQSSVIANMTIGVGYTKSDDPFIEFNCETDENREQVIQYIERMERFFDSLFKSVGIWQLNVATKSSAPELHLKLGEFINKQRGLCEFSFIETILIENIEDDLLPPDRVFENTLHYTLQEAMNIFHVLIANHWIVLQCSGQSPLQYMHIEIKQTMDMFWKNGLDAFFDIYLRGIVVSHFLAPEGKLTITYHHHLMQTIWFRRKFIGKLFSQVLVKFHTAEDTNDGIIVFERHMQNSKKRSFDFHLRAIESGDFVTCNENDCRTLILCSMLKDLNDDYKQEELNAVLNSCSKFLDELPSEYSTILIQNVKRILRKNHKADIVTFKIWKNVNLMKTYVAESFLEEEAVDNDNSSIIPPPDQIRDVIVFDEKLCSSEVINDTNTRVVIKFYNETDGWDGFIDDLLLRVTHLCSVQNIVFVTHTTTDLDMLFSAQFYKKTIQWLKHELLFQPGCCIYFARSTTSLSNLYSCDRLFITLKMSAVILPFENESLQRKYPFGYDIDEFGTDTLQEVIWGQEKIEWVRIRNEPQDERVHHGCLGLTRHEKNEIELLRGVDKSGRKNRRKRKLDNQQPPGAPTQNNNNENDEPKPEPEEMEITPAGKKYLDALYDCVLKHGKVTLVNDLDSDNIICTTRNPKTLIIRLPEKNKEERNNDGDDNDNDRKEDN